MQVVPPRLAPARSLSRSAGALLFSFLVAAGCERAGELNRGPSVLELDSTRIELPDSIALVLMRIDRARPGEVEPLRATVRVGDIVRFEAQDGAGHAIAFGGALLASDARGFLEQTGQMRSPPLMSRGNAWVVSFAHAPAGEYPFTCVTHNARAAITVNQR